ncbi:uncharacterized protein MELLADRAFT_58361 [Melampsora larici-populina 98AG31]|uniref:Uncharacterized protein n=1 Tax=Melampsora larici-populina (strain 98AG31 / pathotype 3-4-7) TaxID=747676 RepID=F4R377_MELLP|nr:uncharacterized protein MELLADRAFT_58361 [Melampsora larici-populina 98AG31]EGG13216.1 hypothetical protein MELLADRAFT_58361 [Melampsora larici-populina 98AG31]
MALPGQEIQNPKNKKRKSKGRGKSRLAKLLKTIETGEGEVSAAAVNGLLGEGRSNTPIQDELCIYEAGQDGDWTDNEVKDDHPYVSYKERTQREQAQWTKALPSMFIEFMKCSKKTYQWGDETIWNQDWKTACQCTDVRERSVDVVDITSKKFIFM